MSDRDTFQHTQQAFQFPVKVNDNPCEQTVPKAEASKNATCNTQQPGATAVHQTPRPPDCWMTLCTNFVSPPGVRHSDFAVSAGTDIVPIGSCRRTGVVADKHPSQLVTRSMNLHAQPLLTCENSPPRSSSPSNFHSTDFCSSVQNDCSRKPKAALPASVDPDDIFMIWNE